MALMFSFFGISESTLCSAQLYVETCLRQVEMLQDRCCCGGEVKITGPKRSSKIKFIVKRGIIEMDVQGIEKS